MKRQKQILLDELIPDWSKIGEVSNHPFNTRFKKAAQKLSDHYHLIRPAIVDPTLPRTTSLLENLYSQIKHVLRKWSGTKQVLPTFQWAAQLASITQSFNDNSALKLLLDQVTSYDWVEKAIQLSRQRREYRFQIHFANSIVAKSPQAIARMLDNLVMRDIIS